MWESYYNVDTMEKATSLLAEIGSAARIVAGATDLILELERGQRKGTSTLIDISRVPNQNLITEDESGIIHLGPMVTHNDCVNSSLLEEKALPLVLACWQVGSPQIRNRGTIAGNLITGSPANDCISPLMAMNACVILQSIRGKRSVNLQDFYTGVRKTVMQPDEVLVDIQFPAMKSSMKGVYLKSALRKAQAISVVNASIILEFSGETVKKASITLGAVAPKIIHAENAEGFLAGKTLSSAVIAETAKLANAAARPIDDVRGSASYRSYTVGILVKHGLERIANHTEAEGLLLEPPLLDTGTDMGKNNEFYGGIDKSSPIITTINGEKRTIYSGQHKTLLRFLREDAGLTEQKKDVVKASVVPVHSPGWESRDGMHGSGTESTWSTNHHNRRHGDRDANCTLFNKHL
jgi:carbon-monoxide dehydrogenase medium subunit